ncbi:amidinotransferase [Archangium violaceum]|uniref:Amidinotransferase n=1 Tax=Archangium violaceum Cb vi76 TaxID=1406225 RepID=A0A084STE6_9BACT|nr:amidinotransferase [Archangium violaceum]KFA91731.1 amidinotransferase [Archangium violaceum Cb vi76]
MIAPAQLQTSRSLPVVNAFTEWDLLEEVIVGVVDNATFPEWHISLKATVPDNMWDLFQRNAGRPFPPERIAAAKKDLEELVHILEAEGVTVRRPEALDFRRPIVTPHFASSGGLYAAMPRDVLLVVGDEVIESPMAWRSRYFEPLAYRALIKEYFRAGARWTAAPKPELKDELYVHDFVDPTEDEPPRYVITDTEPTFDAADFIKFGRDLVVQKSNVTNEFGIRWLQRHLEGRFRVHVVEPRDTHPMHIDATIMPLAPGKLLVNPHRFPKVPSLFRGWDILEAPTPSIPDGHPLYMTSKWINMNLLSLDEKRVVVERSDEPMISALRRWGFTPIPCNFRNFNTFGGSFHCATVDVRRRGDAVSYL